MRRGWRGPAIRWGVCEKASEREWERERRGYGRALGRRVRVSEWQRLPSPSGRDTPAASAASALSLFHSLSLSLSLSLFLSSPSGLGGSLPAAAGPAASRPPPPSLASPLSGALVRQLGRAAPAGLRRYAAGLPFRLVRGESPWAPRRRPAQQGRGGRRCGGHLRSRRRLRSRRHGAVTASRRSHGVMVQSRRHGAVTASWCSHGVTVRSRQPHSACSRTSPSTRSRAPQPAPPPARPAIPAGHEPVTRSVT